MKTGTASWTRLGLEAELSDATADPPHPGGPRFDHRADPQAAKGSERALFLLVCALLEERFNISLGNVHPGSDLVRDLKLDPIDVEDLPLALEEAFEIDISNADAGRIATIEDAVRCVARGRSDGPR